mmetsp:Transcript_28231/g.40925  ORF Transcript_28231/g.40925 Transcript_28231/m.40925 type:complete len:104 (-) Transcript_28231:1759-2070(-)
MKRREKSKKDRAQRQAGENGTKSVDGGQKKKKRYASIRRIFHRFGLRAPRWLDSRKGKLPVSAIGRKNEKKKINNSYLVGYFHFNIGHFLAYDLLVYFFEETN